MKPTKSKPAKPASPLPRLIKIEEFAAAWGITGHQKYAAVRRLPAGVRVRLGTRVRINLERVQAWFAAGGELAGE